MNEIKLPSGRIVGPNQPPFIIAEIGSNWRTLDDCLHSIAKAKECGADAVKFQLFTGADLYGFQTYPCNHEPKCRDGNTEIAHPFFRAELFEEYKKAMPFGDGEIINYRGQLPTGWLPKLKAKADACGIEFMCSAFSPELIDAVDSYVNIHKLASAEMCHVRMLEKLKQIGKPVIMSTGAQYTQDISRALNILGDAPVVLMYCIAAYPAREVNLALIDMLASRGHMVGYSDHSLDVLELPLMASIMGAVVLEKHFTAIDANTPDSDHSLDPYLFAVMVNSVRKMRNFEICPVREEQPMILRHKRRLIATRDIKQGDKLVEGVNFGIYRSIKDDTHALSPFAIDCVNGKVAIKEIKAGDGIGPGDFN